MILLNVIICRSSGDVFFTDENSHISFCRICRSRAYFSFQRYGHSCLPKWVGVLAYMPKERNFIYLDAAAAAKLLQSCLTLCDPVDGSPPGSPVPGILQARTLEWVAISFSNTWKWKWSHSVVSDPWRPHGLQLTRLLRPWVSSKCICLYSP